MRRAALGVVLALLTGAAMAPAQAEQGFDWPLPDWMPRPPVPEAVHEEPALSDFEGVVRDERGVHLPREEND